MNQSSSSSTPFSSFDLEIDETTLHAVTTEMASSETERNCQLNDNFGLLVQGILAAVAFSTLICE